MHRNQLIAVACTAALALTAGALGWAALDSARRRSPFKHLRTGVGRTTIFSRVDTTSAPPGRPPVVLVHGLGVSGRYMHPTAECLARDFPVLIPDLPGFGRSGRPRAVLDVPELADTLAAWMSAVGVRRAVLLGNSLGCQVIADLAARNPDRVIALVLAGPTVDAAARTAPRQLLRLAADAFVETFPLHAIVAFDYLSAGLRRIAVTIRHALDDAIERTLPAIGVPTLVVRGSRDPLVPQRWAEELTRRLPRGRLAVIPGGSHAVNYSAARALAALVRRFLLSELTGPDAPAAAGRRESSAAWAGPRHS